MLPSQSLRRRASTAQLPSDVVGVSRQVLRAIYPVLQELRQQGIITPKDIAAALHERGFPPLRQGGQWNENAVRTVLHRIDVAVAIEELKREGVTDLGQVAWHLNRRKIPTDTGTPWTEEKAQEALSLEPGFIPRESASEYTARILPLLQEMKRRGMTSVYQMTKELNAQGVPSARGGVWTDSTVLAMLENKVISIIKEIEKAGIRTLEGIAQELNRRDIPSPGGKEWLASTVQRLLKASTEYAPRKATPDFDQKILEQLRLIREAGIHTLAGMVRALNERGIKTVRGEDWNRASLRLLLQRHHLWPIEGEPPEEEVKGRLPARVAARTRVADDPAASADKVRALAKRDIKAALSHPNCPYDLLAAHAAKYPDLVLQNSAFALWSIENPTDWGTTKFSAIESKLNVLVTEYLRKEDRPLSVLLTWGASCALPLLPKINPSGRAFAEKVVSSSLQWAIGHKIDRKELIADWYSTRKTPQQGEEAYLAFSVVTRLCELLLNSHSSHAGGKEIVKNAVWMAIDAASTLCGYNPPCQAQELERLLGMLEVYGEGGRDWKEDAETMLSTLSASVGRRPPRPKR